MLRERCAVLSAQAPIQATHTQPVLTPLDTNSSRKSSRFRVSVTWVMCFFLFFNYHGHRTDGLSGPWLARYRARIYFIITSGGIICEQYGVLIRWMENNPIYLVNPTPKFSNSLIHSMCSEMITPALCARLAHHGKPTYVTQVTCRETWYERLGARAERVPTRPARSRFVLKSLIDRTMTDVIFSLSTFYSNITITVYPNI